jgi:uncharacterized protein
MKSSTHANSRLEFLRAEIDRLMLDGNLNTDHATLRKYIAHMYGVARLCTVLAIKRDLDTELATTIGLLHDIDYMTGRGLDNHAVKAAEQAKEVLESMRAYNTDEIGIIVSAIRWHDDIDLIHAPYDELLKDADVMDHYLQNPDSPISERKAPRLKRLCSELGIKSHMGE